jgi:hypothetical protein
VSRLRGRARDGTRCAGGCLWRCLFCYREHGFSLGATCNGSGVALVYGSVGSKLGYRALGRKSDTL